MRFAIRSLRFRAALCGRPTLSCLRLTADCLLPTADCGLLTADRLSFNLRDLIDAPLMTSALERRGEPQRHDLVRERERDDASADGEHVRIVVLAREARGVEVVAERGADALDLVRGHLFALSAA